MSIFLSVLRCGIYNESKRAQDDYACIVRILGTYLCIEGFQSIELSLRALNLNNFNLDRLIFMVNGYPLCAQDEFEDAQKSGEIWTPEIAFDTTLGETRYLLFFRLTDTKKQEIEVVPIKQNRDDTLEHPDKSELKNFELRTLCLNNPVEIACVMYRLMGYKSATALLENMFPMELSVTRVKNFRKCDMDSGQYCGVCLEPQMVIGQCSRCESPMYPNTTSSTKESIQNRIKNIYNL
mgnify:CR=1 FL=1